MANVFSEHGISRGDRVMVILKRHFEYWFATIALHKLGAVMIPATHMLTVNDLVYRLNASKVKAIVCTAQNEVPQKIKEAVSKTDLNPQLFCVQKNVDGCEDLTTAAENASEDLKEKYEDPDYTLVKGVTSSDVYADLSTWMFDESRKAGDKFYINIGNYYYAIYLESDLYRDESYATSAQIIALPTSDTLKEEDAKKDLQAKIDEWAKGTKDEDSFIAIRTSNSDKLSGGLYMISEVQTNDLPEDILSWMFDDSRKEGDYTVISDSEGAYAIYWVEVAENPVWYETASSAIKYEKYKTEIEALKANYPLVEK